MQSGGRGFTDLEKWPAALRGLHHVRAGRLRLGEGHVALVLHVWHGADENPRKVEKMMGEKREALRRQRGLAIKDRRRWWGPGEEEESGGGRCEWRRGRSRQSHSQREPETN